MRKIPHLFTGLLVLTLLTGSMVLQVPASPSYPWMEKIDSWVLQRAELGETEILIFLTEQADLSDSAQLNRKREKGNYVYQKLTEVAARSQKPILMLLENWGVDYRPYWVANMIWVSGDMSLIKALAERPDVSHIYANPAVRVVLPSEQAQASRLNSLNTPTWNLVKINVDDAWAAGYAGQGVVIGGQDTGYRWDHEALINQYRGWDGSSANHDYNWHDAIHSSTGDCGADSPEPCDDYGLGHGTHTMGIMVGDDGQSNQIGVAPGARWIGCRNMDSGFGSPATYSECYQWFIAPYPIGGDPFTDGDPSKAPDVINNSWSCPSSEGCNPDSLATVVEAVHAAGIVTVHSAGNSGPGCGSISTPSAIYAESFTVGSTNSLDNIALSSSRGPVTVDGSNRFKPNVSAPGVSILSSFRDAPNSYGYLSGTSMAAPHVAGLVALLISAQPSLAGQVDEIESIIEQSALPRYTLDGCGGDTVTTHPNHTYGWGRIDALESLQNTPRTVDIEKTASSPAVLVGEHLTYTLQISNLEPNFPTHNLVLTDTLPEGTQLITATLPFTLGGNAVTWKRNSLDSQEVWQTRFVVEVLPTATGTVDNLNYSISSDETSLPVSGSTVSTIVHAPEVDLSPDLYSFSHAGQVATYIHTLTNMGNYTDTFDLSHTSSQGWTVSYQTPVTLGAGQSTSVFVGVDVPLNAPNGTVESTSIIATSQADPSVTATATDTTKLAWALFFPWITTNP